MLLGIDTEALLICDVRPYISFDGNFLVNSYTPITSSMAFCHTINSRYPGPDDISAFYYPLPTICYPFLKHEKAGLMVRFLSNYSLPTTRYSLPTTSPALVVHSCELPVELRSPLREPPLQLPTRRDLSRTQYRLG